MARRRPPSIPQRRPVFIGCEGESEMAYAGLLQTLLRDEGLPVHLVIHDLGLGAGDPLARVRLAVKRLERLKRVRIAPSERFVMLDTDQTVRDAERAEGARRLAAANDIEIVWQNSCFEAMLLRHLPGLTALRPPDTATAVRAMERHWPGYRKPMPKAMLARRIDRDALRRAGAVEPGLMSLLRCLGLADR